MRADLGDLGVTTFGQSRLPAQTPYWESVSVPGVYFAGTISQGAAGLIVGRGRAAGIDTPSP